MPHLPAPKEGTCEGEVQVDNISKLSARPANRTPGEFGEEQCKDPNLLPLMLYLEEGRVPSEEAVSLKVLAQAPQFTMVKGALYIMDSRQKDRLQVVVPDHHATRHDISTLERWLVTSQDQGSIRQWSTAGGGMACTQIPCSMPITVRNV